MISALSADPFFKRKLFINAPFLSIPARLTNGSRAFYKVFLNKKSLTERKLIITEKSLFCKYYFLTECDFWSNMRIYMIPLEVIYVI